LFSVVLLGAGCSSYERRWTAAQAAARASDPFVGSYAGKWGSFRYKNATGKLWCILTQQSPDIYLAEFRATWHGIFSSTHTVTLRVTDRAKAAGRPIAAFTGAAEIKMWIGSGRYHCTGKLSPTSFVAEYDADYDRGRFELQRIPPPPQKR
jgi:hypothetical protein